MASVSLLSLILISESCFTAITTSLSKKAKVSLSQMPSVAIVFKVSTRPGCRQMCLKDLVNKIKLDSNFSFTTRCVHCINKVTKL